MLSTHHVLRVGAVILGILAALFGAIALSAFGMWLLDQSSPNGDWQELVVAIAVGLLAAGCALGHHWARSAARRWPRAESTPSAL